METFWTPKKLKLNNNQNAGGLGGMGGMSRNSLGGAAQLSPYLNFDPSYLQVPSKTMNSKLNSSL